MKLLLDTHILIWSLEQNPRLAARLIDVLENESNQLLISQASFFEMAIKINLGKLESPLGLSFPQLKTHLEQRNVKILTLEPEHLETFRGLPLHHKDPFDRMLIAQAIFEKATLVSDDEFFGLYAVELI
jgi:PIN domain nuclease of toxin-antitoxin system